MLESSRVFHHCITVVVRYVHTHPSEKHLKRESPKVVNYWGNAAWHCRCKLLLCVLPVASNTLPNLISCCAPSWSLWQPLSPSKAEQENTWYYKTGWVKLCTVRWKWQPLSTATMCLPLTSNPETKWTCLFRTMTEICHYIVKHNYMMLFYEVSVKIFAGFAMPYKFCNLNKEQKSLSKYILADYSSSHQRLFRFCHFHTILKIAHALCWDELLLK